jgi:hypothetical protein
MFARGSRYANLPTAVHTAPDGSQVRYVPLRTIRTDVPVQDVHVVADGDRFDLVAFAAYADPTQFWRICDGNRGMWPDDLLAVAGRALLVPAPR